MGEGILDNRDTEHRYWLLLEPMKKPLINSNSNPESVDEVSLPSPLANHMSRRLDHSPIQFICSGKKKGSRLLNFRFDKKHTNVLPIKIESSPIVKYFFHFLLYSYNCQRYIPISKSRIGYTFAQWNPFIQFENNFKFWFHGKTFEFGLTDSAPSKPVRLWYYDARNGARKYFYNW